MKHILTAIIIITFTATIGLAADKKPADKKPQPTISELNTQVGQLQAQSIIMLGKIQMVEQMIDELFVKKSTLKATRDVIIKQFQSISKQIEERTNDKPVQK